MPRIRNILPSKARAKSFAEPARIIDINELSRPAGSGSYRRTAEAIAGARGRIAIEKAEREIAEAARKAGGLKARARSLVKKAERTARGYRQAEDYRL